MVSAKVSLYFYLDTLIFQSFDILCQFVAAAQRLQLSAKVSAALLALWWCSDDVLEQDLMFLEKKPGKSYVGGDALTAFFELKGLKEAAYFFVVW